MVQPHTSAGRVPSDAGYRTYVDELMQPETLGNEDRRRIRDDLREASRELDDVIENATRLLGRLSNNLAFVTKPQPDTQAFKHIQLIWLSPRTGVAVVVTSLGVAAQTLFELGSDVDADALTRLSNALNARLWQSSDARHRRRRHVRHRARTGSERRSLCRRLGRAAQRTLARRRRRSPLRARKICSISPSSTICASCARFCASSRSRRRCTKWLPTRSGAENASVKIGAELGIDELADLSVVTVPYRFGPSAIGMLSILGPRRMPYARLLALASGTAQTLSERLSDVAQE